eukprot:3890970-Amphidinium_carterae.1
MDSRKHHAGLRWTGRQRRKLALAWEKCHGVSSQQNIPNFCFALSLQEQALHDCCRHHSASHAGILYISASTDCTVAGRAQQGLT